MAEISNQEFPDTVLLFFVARQIGQSAKSLSESATGKLRFALCQRLYQRRNENRIVLRPHCGDSRVGEFVAIGRRVQKFQHGLRRLRFGVTAQGAQSGGQNVRVLLRVQNLAGRMAGTLPVKAAEIGDHLPAHARVALIG